MDNSSPLEDAIRHQDRITLAAVTSAVEKGSATLAFQPTVKAGIDMALRLTALELGDDIAKAIQLGIEYDPEPPFDDGSPEKAGPELTGFLRQIMGAGAGV